MFRTAGPAHPACGRPAPHMTSIAHLISSGPSVQAARPSLTAADLPVARRGDGGGALPKGLYLHVPFCFHKCHYCDFYSFVDSQGRQPAYTERLLEEIEASQAYLEPPLETIFIGGGTPTLLEPRLLGRVLEELSPLHAAEVTVEANPETVTGPLLEVLVAGGVNRISMGAQSFHPGHLRMLERHHDPASVRRSVELARAAGIDNINLDLIFAIPGQVLGEWLSDLEAALALQPEHLSCYGLTYEPNTPLTARLRSGAVARVDEDVEAEMYVATLDRLADAGFEHYEISNWARPGRRCRHNMLYWTNQAWWPCGPSASGHSRGVRWKNVPNLGAYLQSRGLPPVTDSEQLGEEGRAGEALMLGLRLIEGIGLPDLAMLLAAGSAGERRAEAIERHIAGALLVRDRGRLALTRRGLLLADTVLADLL